jgi:hypothetical protein
MFNGTFRGVLNAITKGLVAVALVTLLSNENLVWSRVLSRISTQSGGASISGTVTDPSGALLGGAKVTAKNSMSGEKRQTDRPVGPA